LVGLVKVPLKDVALLPLAPTVIEPVTVGTPQLYVVPTGTISEPPFTGVLLNEAPLQAVRDFAAITGFGFTVTVTVNVPP
jgi:hypothetical protein